jgi:RNase H
MSAIFYACNLIENFPIGKFVILSDSFSALQGIESVKVSYRTNDMLFRTKCCLKRLEEIGYEVLLMWIPAHVGIPGNEEADALAKAGATSGDSFQEATGLPTANLADLRAGAFTRLKDEWQKEWDKSDMGRYCFSIMPQVSCTPWIVDMSLERKFIVYLARIASNHTRTGSHLQRINIVNDALCRCALDYETVDHIVWSCGLHDLPRRHLQDTLLDAGVEHSTPVRDLLASRNFVALKAIFEYFDLLSIKI